MKLTPLLYLAPVLVTLGAVFGYYAKHTAPTEPVRIDPPAFAAPRANGLTSPKPTAPQTDRITRLEEELRQLSNKVVRLENQQPALKPNDANNQTRNSPGTWGTNSVDETASMADNLVKAGIEVWRADEIARKQSQWALARLELRDKAVREDYLRSPQYRQEMRELLNSEPSVRDEIGTDLYDKYLYQSGQNNRVAVSSIMAGSAAEQAGMRSGDLILSYNDQRLFDSRQLQNLTTAGERGETISVTVARGGNEIALALPRGPLGVGLQAASADPEN
jgi:hypothetical protein